MGINLPVVDFGDNFVVDTVSLGSLHSCALSTIHTAKVRSCKKIQALRRKRQMLFSAGEMATMEGWVSMTRVNNGSPQLPMCRC